jgi:hypothetical protein
MPRPKPPEEIKPRCVKLSDKQWLKFKTIGGSEWLRTTLDGRVTRPVTAEKTERNRRVRIDRTAGMLIKDIAAKHAVSWRTVLRILK